MRRAALGGLLVTFSLLAPGVLGLAGSGPVPAAGAATYAAKCIPRPVPFSPDTRLHNVSFVAHGRLRTFTVTSPVVGVTHVNV